MKTIKISEDINYSRRRFLGVAAMSIAGAEFIKIGSANAQSSQITPAGAPTIKPGTNTSFGSLKQVRPTVVPSFFCTAGPTTFTVLSMLPLCWRRRDTG